MIAVWKQKEVRVLMRDFRYGYAIIKNLDDSGIKMYVPLHELTEEQNCTSSESNTGRWYGRI